MTTAPEQAPPGQPPAAGCTYPPVPGRLTRQALRAAYRTPVWAGPVAVAVCLAGGVAYTLVTDPVDADAFASPTCLLKLTTGFDCPGCGGTRAFWYLIHGNLPQAARNHAPFVFAVPFLVYWYAAWTVKLITRRDVLPPLRPSPLALTAFLGVWMAFSVLRNLPWAPFTALYV